MISRKRHISKALSWRVIGSIDTMLIDWFMTGSIEIGVAIGGIEVITKTILYYFHERVWYNYISLGIKDEQSAKKGLD